MQYYFLVRRKRDLIIKSTWTFNFTLQLKFRDATANGGTKPTSQLLALETHMSKDIEVNHHLVKESRLVSTSVQLAVKLVTVTGVRYYQSQLLIFLTLLGSHRSHEKISSPWGFEPARAPWPATRAQCLSPPSVRLVYNGRFLSRPLEIHIM